MNRNPELFRID